MRVADSLVFWLSHIVRWFTVWTTAQHLSCLMSHKQIYQMRRLKSLKFFTAVSRNGVRGATDWALLVSLHIADGRSSEIPWPLHTTSARTHLRESTLGIEMLRWNLQWFILTLENRMELAKTCEDQVATRVNAHPPRLFVYDIMICSAKIREVGNHTLREQEIARRPIKDFWQVNNWGVCDSLRVTDHPWPLNHAHHNRRPVPSWNPRRKHRLHRPSCWSAPCEGVTRRNMKRSAKDLNANVNKNACGWQVWLLVPARLFWKIQKVTGDNRHEKCINSHCPSSWALSQECARPNLPASEDTLEKRWE